MSYYPLQITLKGDLLEKLEAAAEQEGMPLNRLNEWIIEVLDIYASDGIVDGRDLRKPFVESQDRLAERG